MVTALTAVLSNQYQLVNVQLSSLRVQYAAGIAILSALALLNGKTLAKLNILNFFDTNVYALGDDFNNILGRFSKLSELHVNYNCVNDGAIAVLAKNVSKTLQLLCIDVYGAEPHNHVISASVWRQFKKDCPRVKVSFDLDDIEQHHEFISILTPGIPLHSLKIWTGYDIEDESRLPALFVYLADNFNETIGK
jgi:hypothetical protein